MNDGNFSTFEGRGERAARQRARALEAFLAKKREFDALVAELQQMSDDHFGADPEELHWGHVGDVEHYVALLHQATDGYFRRGEFAPEPEASR